MSKRTVYTSITPLPKGITRDSVLATLYDHLEMIDLQPNVEERHPIKSPSSATAEEYHCQWYSLTDKVQYLPGGLYTGKVSYNVCFHNLPSGMQAHVYAPLGLDIRNKWTLGGSLPGEPREPVEIGLGMPKDGLWLREDVDMRCNILLTAFVKKNLKKAHNTLVARLVEKAHLITAEEHNNNLLANSDTASMSSYGPTSPGFPPPLFSTAHSSLTAGSVNSMNYVHGSNRNSYQFPPERQSMQQMQNYEPMLSPGPPPRYSQQSAMQPPLQRERSDSPYSPQNVRVSHHYYNTEQLGPVSPPVGYMDPAYAQANPYIDHGYEEKPRPWSGPKLQSSAAVELPGHGQKEAAEME